MTLAFSEEAKQRAKEKGHYLIRVDVSGHAAKKGTVRFAFDLPEEQTGDFLAYITAMLNAQEKREREARR